MAVWREKYFIWMLRNAQSATDYFRIPPEPSRGTRYAGRDLKPPQRPARGRYLSAALHSTLTSTLSHLRLARNTLCVFSCGFR